MKLTRKQIALLLSLILIYSGMSGILANIMGVYMAAIRGDLGFGAGELSVYYTIKALVSAALVSWGTSRVLAKNGKKLFFILQAMSILGFLMMAFSSSLWQFYLAAVIGGIGNCAFLVVIPIVLNNWFVKNRGLLLGITLSSSGIVGAVLSPVASSVIDAFGWRQAIIMTCILCVFVMLVPTALWYHNTPEEVGEQPYGVDEVVDEQKETVVHVERDIPKHVFLVVTFALIGSGVLIMYSAQLAMFAQSVGFTLAQGAILTSWCMIGNVAGKLIMGVLLDKIGVYKSGWLFQIAVMCGMLLFLLGQGSLLMLQVGALLYGLAFGYTMNLTPALMLETYGPTQYRAKMSRFQSIQGLCGAASSTLFPMIYDMTGTYNPVFIFGLVFLTIAIVLFGWLKKFNTQVA